MPRNREEWRDFLLRACHDLKTSLRAVRTSAEMLAKSSRKPEGPDLEAVLGFLVHGARNANALADGLSNYALAMDVQPNVRVPTGVLLRGAMAKLAAEIRESGAEVTHGELPQVFGDADRLMQLFENLLRNAVEHRGPAPPRIEVGAHEEGKEWLFAVRDHGPGIEAEDLERIFRPFERLRRDHGGAGLGLAISKEIVAGHGGRIWAERASGEGTIFYFTLPVDAGVAPPPRAAGAGTPVRRT